MAVSPGASVAADYNFQLVLGSINKLDINKKINCQWTFGGLKRTYFGSYVAPEGEHPTMKSKGGVSLKAHIDGHGASTLSNIQVQNLKVAFVLVSQRPWPALLSYRVFPSIRNWPKVMYLLCLLKMKKLTGPNHL